LKLIGEGIKLVVFARKIVMASHKPFTAQRIAQCLGVLDQLHASGMAAREFAAVHQHSYDQLRAWLRHEPRWRAGEQSGCAAAAPKQAMQFAPVHLQSSTHEMTAPHMCSAQPIRIACTSQDGKRSASIHFPPAQGSIALSAQWLATYLTTTA
jgi:hypothetical protein